MKILLSVIFIWQFVYGSIAQVAPGLCWKISGDDLKKDAYILGTMHAGDARIRDWPKGVEKAFKKSKVVVTELNLNQTPNVSGLMKLFEMPDNKTLRDLISDEFYADLQKYFTDSVGTDLLLFNKFPPILIIGIMNKESMLPGNDNNNDALDIWLFRRAERMGKKVTGIETFEEQVQMFHQAPPDSQALWLYQAFYHPGTFELKTSIGQDDMLQLYMAADLDGMLRAYEQTKIESRFLAAVDDYFIRQRNLNMFERSRVLFRKKRGVFLAVGALHLAGPDGLLELYRKAGYKVEMVE